MSKVELDSLIWQGRPELAEILIEVAKGEMTAMVEISVAINDGKHCESAGLNRPI
ncbi:hypothetical protein D3C84_958920 [compost metagenome]